MASKVVSKKEEDEESPSSDEQIEEQDSEEEENSSEEDPSEEEEDQEKVISPPKKLLLKPQPQISESESEAEYEDSPSAYKLQPIPKPSVSKEKRAHEEISNGHPSSKSSKKSKIEGKSGTDLLSTPTPVGGCITRLWDDGDEVTLLKGLVEYKNMKNGDIAGADYDNIKGKLKVDVSKDQFRTKVGRLKKRFLNALKKGRDGMDPVFSKPHDVKVFELSKVVWGDADGEKKGSKADPVAMVPKRSAKKVEKIRQDEEDSRKNEKDDEGTNFSSNFPFLISSFSETAGKFPLLEISDGALKIIKDKLCLIENTKTKDLNEKWRKLLIEEVELQYKRLALMKEQIKLALDQ